MPATNTERRPFIEPGGRGSQSRPWIVGRSRDFDTDLRGSGILALPERTPALVVQVAEKWVLGRHGVTLDVTSNEIYLYAE